MSRGAPLVLMHGPGDVGLRDLPQVVMYYRLKFRMTYYTSAEASKNRNFIVIGFDTWNAMSTVAEASKSETLRKGTLDIVAHFNSMDVPKAISKVAAEDSTEDTENLTDLILLST
ncbi:hypothetical protein HZH66_014294 [Vespula vulgaris]|uniref:Uncharacterized protein n=1 Tax=Vespula vulgaris TaxID=7454 RepID=A0A834J3B5_VESVU|nr:hypothetical protein HZH66_014294 [Vespula vulgaris]